MKGGPAGLTSARSAPRPAPTPPRSIHRDALTRLERRRTLSLSERRATQRFRRLSNLEEITCRANTQTRRGVSRTQGRLLPHLSAAWWPSPRGLNRAVKAICGERQQTCTIAAFIRWGVSDDEGILVQATLLASIRVKAETQAEAELKLREALSASDANLGRLDDAPII